MNRRQFLGVTLISALGAGAIGASRYWPEQGWRNPCLETLPQTLRDHPLLQEIWAGLDAQQVWDCHVHLAGGGDGGDNVWLNPGMGSPWHPLLSAQGYFYKNASCVDQRSGRLDQSYAARLIRLAAEMRGGFKAMLFAFDWFHDENGDPDPKRSMFYVPNSYAAELARARSDVFEWVASIHPYRPDCVEALQVAVGGGARAVKWLPSAMGIDPMSPKCDPFYEALAAQDIPVISHAGRELAVQGGNQEFGNPLRLRRAMDHGVRVVVAHCASDGDDQDLDQGAHGPRVRSFILFKRLMDEPRYAKTLHADISALTQLNRAWALKEVLQREEWHARLLNGSDYPLPGVMPLFSATDMVRRGLLPREFVSPLKAIRVSNPLLFDFALKRLLRFGEHRFPVSIFETRRFFERNSA